jgi:hypothetical protein
MDHEERSAHLTDYMSKAIAAKDLAERTFSEAMDVSAAFGYEMGIMTEKARIEGEIDAFTQTLTDNEEDAKLVLEVIRQIVSRMDEETDE